MRVTWDTGKRPEALREPDERDETHLEILRASHDKADHGVCAIEALVYCYESRISTPQWLSDWIGEHLVSWLDGDVSSLDESLQVQSPGKGKPPRIKQIALERARHDDASEIFVLNEFFGVSIPTAAEMVYQRNVELFRQTPSGLSLAQSYYKNGARNSGETRSAYELIFRDKKRRRQWLARFPYKGNV